MKKILVTGSVGFLGCNLCIKLCQSKENYVIGIDNLMTSEKSNLEKLLEFDNFKFLETDVIEYDTYSSLEVDEIYNAACPASPIWYQKDPIHTTLTCVLGTKNLLELATVNNAKLLQFSTSEVYGSALQHPQNEAYWGNVNPCGIRSCYDEGKRCAESLCFDFKRTKGTDVRVVRIFNTYGPYMNKEDGRVISNYITQALNKKPITIYGDGSQTRSMCFVDDLLDAILLFMSIKKDDVPYSPINIGNPREIDMLTLAKTICNLCGSGNDFEFLPLPSDDPPKRKPDISAAMNLLGWSPKIRLDAGIKKTIEYYKKTVCSE